MEARFQEQHEGAWAIAIPTIEWLKENRGAYEFEERYGANELRKHFDLLQCFEEAMEFERRTIEYPAASLAPDLEDVQTILTIRDNNEAISTQTFFMSCTQRSALVGGMKSHFVRPGDQLEFWERMFACSAACEDVAFELVDHNGYLKSDYSGSGIWQTSLWLNSKNFLVIESVLVGFSFRRNGVGKYMVETILSEAKKRGALWVLGKPEELVEDPGSSRYLRNIDKTEEEKKALLEENVARATKYWRAMGCRSVGTSQWFCYAMNPEHPARQLAAKDNFDP